jgi:polysaccharide deacetylase family protein (PEP-CTERM system associated)
LSEIQPPTLAPHPLGGAADSSDDVAGRRDAVGALRVILSFDVEEHHRIEAAVAAGLAATAAQQAYYAGRMDAATRWLLDELGRRNIRATFFVVGDIARSNPDLVRAIHRGGHEVASHGWDHRRVHHFTPESFREDVRRSKEELEQVTGEAVLGYRAPTFSIVRQTAWALDVLAEVGMLYDSSIYPVRHDRYGVPEAPRAPFRAQGSAHEILELPPATWRMAYQNIPTGGGGYFRLLPLIVIQRAIEQIRHECRPAVAMLYFHPWEFDEEQDRLALPWLSRFRTYVGLRRSRRRLVSLMQQYSFERAVDVVHALRRRQEKLAVFPVVHGSKGS